MDCLQYEWHPLFLDWQEGTPSSRGLNTPARIDAFFSSPTFPDPITLNCNFESPLSEWYLMVFGENRLGIPDVFRDIYTSLPNDGTHRSADVFCTSLLATGQHLWQHVGMRGSTEEFESLGAQSALAVLQLLHAIIDRQEELCKVSG
jgi:hypothetical protein